MGSWERPSNCVLEAYLQIKASQDRNLGPQRIRETDVVELCAIPAIRIMSLVFGCRPNIWLKTMDPEDVVGRIHALGDT